MIRGIRNELKIAGANFFIVSVVLVAAFMVLSMIAGELLDLSCVGFEVIFPFYTAIAVGEWGKIRVDDNFDIILAQSRSIFKWVLVRYIAIFGVSSLFSLICMAAITLFRHEMQLWESFLVYFSPAFFLSSLSVVIGLKCAKEHIAALVCGILWFVTLLLRSLLQFPGVEYFYLFIRYVGDQNNIWVINKGIIGAIGLVLWWIAYRNCKNK